MRIMQEIGEKRDLILHKQIKNANKTFVCIQMYYSVKPIQHIEKVFVPFVGS